uniref:Calcineurin-like phosphoesterase domain-containing protein n=1 Tax=Amphora coffeiformis TaxID=265554 RepID=A0A7S3L433_9STRA|eukprot:scaffold22432_cov168-Amphora_coffeaeformis.AAC.9
MDEDYDELMGPRPGQDMRKVFKDDPSPLPAQEPVKRSSAGPPPTLFHSMPDRWAQHEDDDMNRSNTSSSRRRSDIMSFDEEEDEAALPQTDPRNIRQEALRMLEVADSGAYSVHRTVTGGFMAEPRSMGNNKRVPTALAGLGTFTNPAARSSKPRFPSGSPTSVYRDDPPMEEDYVYSDDRFAVNQVNEEKKESSSWSSRYSVDETLLAMSGGSVSSPAAKSTSSFLDKLDMQSGRSSARNMFGSSPAKEPKIFGSGFNFRQKKVFGKQGVTVSAPGSNSNNLRTVWMDAGANDSPARSWMDDLRDKRNKRRNYMIMAAVLCAFLVTLAALLGARNNSGDLASSASKIGPNGEEALTFFITSDIPFDSNEEKKLAKDLTKLSKQADFLVHLGSIQDPEVTQCAAEQYEKVANILLESPVPVFVVPGEEDWSNCPDQDQAWYNWLDNFLNFESNFDKDYDVMRDSSLRENFAFVDRGVLFIGVHEVNGRIDDVSEVQARNAINVRWIDAMANTYRDEVRAMVIFGNGRPFLQENNNFYMGMANVLYQLNFLPTAYIHANDGDGDESLVYKPYDIEGMDHVVAIQSSPGASNEPLRIHIGWDDTNPFIVG